MAPGRWRTHVWPAGHDLEDVRRLGQEVAEVSVTARSRRGEVTVTVGAHGELRDLRFTQQALTQLSAQKLARMILTLAAEAREDAAAQAREKTAAFLPGDVAERVRDGATSLLDLLPSPPRIPDFGQE
jgi:DNA-binding protein YbaB